MFQLVMAERRALEGRPRWDGRMNLAQDAQPQDGGNHDQRADAWLVYDGDCPFCSRYVQYLRLRQAAGPVRLVNAREGGPLVDELQRAGLDLDNGMVLKLGGRYYHGADCIHALALLSSGSGLFNRINARVFRSPQLSRVLYPVLRAGRNTALRLLGRTKIASPGCSHAKLAGASPDVSNPPAQ
jgi:predicted DCC family thiol-disulfide oxidoreductase YuxK